MHNIIVGASFSGKTNLAKRFAANAAEKGENIVVFDPRKSGGWPASAKKYASASKFVKDFWTMEKAHVFIDEAKVLFTQELKEAERIAYQGRHNGHLVYFIGQRAISMIPPNARNQCGKVFAFKQSVEDSKELAKEYDGPLLNCTSLRKGEFVFSDGFNSGRAHLHYSGPQSEHQPPPQIVLSEG